MNRRKSQCQWCSKLSISPEAYSTHLTKAHPGHTLPSQETPTLVTQPLDNGGEAPKSRKCWLSEDEWVRSRRAARLGIREKAAKEAVGDANVEVAGEEKAGGRTLIPKLQRIKSLMKTEYGSLVDRG